MNNQVHYINGTWKAGQAEAMSVYDSATQSVLWKAQAASQEQCHSAVNAAHDAFKTWSRYTLSQRIHYLHAYAEQLQKHQDDIALTISQEMGKPLPESHAEVKAMINKIPISIEAYEKRCPQWTQTLPTASVTTQHKPHGVFVILGPFNFPGHLPNGHLVPALLAGNTIVLKPSEYTPLTAIKMMQCCEAAGIPAGVVNCVVGGKMTAQALLDEEIQGVLFTGSYQTGKRIHQHFAGRPDILLALEMGGNNPLILADTYDSKAAIDCIIQSAFITSGQRCTCARRLIALRTQANEALLAQCIDTVKGLTVGTYQDDSPVFMGPVISVAAAETILQQQSILQQHGAHVLLAMTQDRQRPALITPGIIDMNTCTLKRDEEIFGPLLQWFWVDTIDEAIRLANQTRYGLAAGCITEDPACFKRCYDGIRAGIINWNCPLTGASSAAPFGGVGCSGNYRPSALYAADYCAYPVVSMGRS